MILILIVCGSSGYTSDSYFTEPQGVNKWGHQKRILPDGSVVLFCASTSNRRLARITSTDTRTIFHFEDAHYCKYYTRLYHG